MTITGIIFRDEFAVEKVKCPNCKESIALIQEDLEQFRCKACGTVFTVEKVND